MTEEAATRSDYQFLVNPPDELLCLICLGVARDPLQHEACGKLFCKECLDRHGRYKACPNCREDDSSYYLDKRSKRNIQELAVKCDNAERMCEWEGMVCTLDEHVATCLYTLLPCPNECKDDDEDIINNFMRKDIEDHLKNDCPNREYECQFCGSKNTFAAIAGVHDDICSKKIVACPNEECSVAVRREEIEEHLESECNHTVISCKYESIGCGVKRKRQDMDEHEEGNKQLHLDMAMNTTVQLRKELDEIASKQYFRETPVVKMERYQHYKERKLRFTSPCFYSAPHGYCMSLTVHIKEETHLSVYVKIRDGNYDEELKWPFVGCIVISLLNQIEDDNHYSMKMQMAESLNMREGSSRGYSKFFPCSWLESTSLANTQYLKDNTLYFRIEVEVADQKPWLHN